MLLKRLVFAHYEATVPCFDITVFSLLDFELSIEILFSCVLIPYLLMVVLELLGQIYNYSRHPAIWPIPRSIYASAQSLSTSTQVALCMLEILLNSAPFLDSFKTFSAWSVVTRKALIFRLSTILLKRFREVAFNLFWSHL